MNTGKITYCVMALCLFFFAGSVRAELHVAYAGPLSGPGAEDGQAMVRSIELHFAALNNLGGIGGQLLVLEQYDDGNDPVRAAEVAARIVQSDALAVIGHDHSDCSLSAAPVYAQAGMPAISPASTAVDLTRDNDWYFRTIYNDEFQGQFLASYIAKVFPGQSVSVLHEGGDLARVFERMGRELELPFVGAWNIADRTSRTAIDDASFAEALAHMRAVDDEGIVFMDLPPATAARAVQRLRDAGLRQRLVGSDAFASRAFLQELGPLEEVRGKAGYYSSGIYVAAPILFDSGNERAYRFSSAYGERYGQAPDWRAAYAYDAAVLVTQALGQTGATGGDPSAERRRFRDFLAGLGRDRKPLEGVTGPTYFDEHGDVPKAAAVGLYKDRRIVSAPTQFQVLPDLNEAARLDASFDMRRVISADYLYLYQTDVVHAGVRGVSLDSLNVEQQSFWLDVYVWFRYQGDIDVGDIVFIDAVDQVQLQGPINEAKEGGTTYQLYRVQGHFRMDMLPAPYGHHLLALRFRHRTLTRNELVFAIDAVGMQDAESDVDVILPSRDRMRRIKELLNPQLGWEITRNIFFQDIAEEHALGHPRFLEGDQRTRSYSRFNIGLEVRQSDFSLRGLVPVRPARWLLGLSLALTLALLVRIRRSHELAKPIWFVQTLTAFALLLAAEAVFGSWLVDELSRKQLEMVSQTFDVLWWIVPAILLSAALSRFVWDPLEERTGQIVPTLLRRFVSFAIYLLAVFAIVGFVFDQKLTSLLATSGVIAMIIGLAIQINISNIFSGIALNLERPFRIGDWIMVHGRTPNPEYNSIGRVVDINWRTTRLETTDNTTVIVPNSVIAEKIVTNFMKPGEQSRFELMFYVDFSQPTERVLQIMNDALQAAAAGEEGPLADPRPKARVSGTTTLGVEYQVRYHIIPREVSPARARHAVTRSIVEHLERAGIRPAYPRRVYEDRAEGFLGEGGDAGD